MDVVARDRAVAAPTAAVATRRAPVDRRVVLAVLAAAAAAGGVLWAAAALGGAARPSLVVDPGAVTRWGSLLVRVASDVAALCTLGVVAVAVLVLPTSAGALLPDAARLLRLSSRWAAAWATASAVGLLLSLSVATALPVQEVLRPEVLALVLELPQTRALLSTLWLAGLVSVWARRTRTPAGGWLVLLTAGAAVLPPLLTGHAAHGDEDSYRTAVVGLAVHVGTASLWAGGLVALALHLRRSPVALAVALPRYSRLALACFLAVGLSGAVTGWAAFSELSQVWTRG